MLTCTLTVMMTTIFETIGDEIRRAEFMSTGTGSMQVTITNYNSTVGLQYLQGRVFDGDHGDWTMTEKVSSKLSFILPKNM